MTKWPVQKPTHRTTQKYVEHDDATDIQKKKLIYFVFRIKTMALAMIVLLPMDAENAWLAYS